MVRVVAIGLLSAALALGACKDDKKKSGDSDETKNTDETPNKDQPAKLPLEPLGVESPKVFNYKYGKGSKLYQQTLPLAKGDSADWKQTIENSLQILETDPNHLSAQFLLGIAYANDGAGDRAIEHFSKALAGDWGQWGPTLAEDGRLAKFLGTAAGKKLLALNDAYKAAFSEQAAAGLLVVARRSRFKKLAKPGKQYASSRAELYAYSLETKRFLRLTHTADSVIGYVESPSKDRIAYLSVTRANVDPEGDIEFENARVGVLDTESFVQIGEPARVKEEAVELMLFYAEGEELRLQTIEPNNLFSVDWEGGKLVETAGDQFADFETLYEMGQADRKQPVLYATLDMARALQPWGAVTKPVNDLIVTKYQIGATGQTVQLPKNAGVKIRRVTLSPNGLYTTFVGIDDACDGKTKSALYVAETKTASPKLVHRGNGLHSVRWIDDNRFAFEAEPNEIRIYDVGSGRTTETIANRAGIALSAISNIYASEHCPQPAKPAVEGVAVDGGVPDEEDQGIEDGEVEEGELDDSEFED